MKRSKKYYQSDLPEIKAEIEKGKIKKLIYRGYEYVYRIDKYTMYKDYCVLIVVGGRYRIRATTTCKKSDIKKNLKVIILELLHK